MQDAAQLEQGQQNGQQQRQIMPQDTNWAPVRSLDSGWAFAWHAREADPFRHDSNRQSRWRGGSGPLTESPLHSVNPGHISDLQQHQ